MMGEEKGILTHISCRVGSAPAPRDVSNPNQYQNNPGTQPLNGGYNQVSFSLWSMRERK